jgi:hypothetical protein
MSGNRTVRVRVRPAVLTGCAALLTVALAVTGYSGAWAAFTATTPNTGNELTTRTTFPDYRTAVTESGPVIYHPFDDAYGSSTAAALFGTPGTYNGAPGVAASLTTAISAAGGGPRGAVTFSEGGYADATSAFPFPGAPVTLEAWVRTGHGGAVVSLLPDAGSSPAAGNVQLYVNAAGEACVGLTLQALVLQKVCGSDADDTKVWTSTDQTAPAWHHIAAVIDPSGAPDTAGSTDGTQVDVYVDGGIVFDRGFSGGTWPSAPSGRVRVGTAAVTAGPAPSTWSGDIDEVAVYGTALSASTIKSHFDVAKGTVSVTGGYAQSVTDSSPRLYWQLDSAPAAAGAVADASGNGHPGTYHSYPDLGVQGAPTGSTTTPNGIGVLLSGVNDISTGASRTTPAAFSTELWFKSSGGTGPLVSFGATQSGPATVPDGAVYLTANGNLASSIRLPQRTMVSTNTYLDNKWHLVTTTMSAGGRMRLYVDGLLVKEDTSITITGALTGFWRWGGGGDYSAYPTQPGAPYFSGVLDEASVYDRELTPEDVAVHWGARL